MATLQPICCLSKLRPSIILNSLFQVLVIPLRVPLEQSPVLFVWQDWALGVLYTKIVCALTMMGPDWAMRRAIERAYRDGIREMDLK